MAPAWALLMMDLDHFKEVNDTYGHQAGDQVLINLVAKVNAVLRQPDHLGRYGGEEFVALLPETSLEEAVSVAERIRAVCASSRPSEPSGLVLLSILCCSACVKAEARMSARRG